MAINIIKNPSFLDTTTNLYDVMSSEGQIVDRLGNPLKIQGDGVNPDHWFYLGGPDYPYSRTENDPGIGTVYPDVSSDGFSYAGAKLVSGVNADGFSKAVLFDFSDPLLKDRILRSGGITQVVPLYQTENKPIKFYTWLKTEGMPNSNPKVSFQGMGESANDSSAGTITYLAQTPELSRKSVTVAFNYPIKYAFVHFLVQNITSDCKIWFVQPYAEELEVLPEDIVEPPGNKVMNYNFFLAGEETLTIEGVRTEETLAWITKKTERVSVTTPAGLTAMLLTEIGSSVEQVGILMNREFGKKKMEFLVQSTQLGGSEIRIVASATGRFKNELNRKEIVKTVPYGNNIDTWTFIKDFMLHTPSAEKLDLKVELISGAPVRVSSVTLFDDITYNGALTTKKNTLINTKSTVDVRLPKHFDTVALPLDTPKKIEKFEVDSDDGFLRRMHITNGKLGEIKPFSFWSNAKPTKFQPMTKVGATDTFTVSGYDWNVGTNPIEDIVMGKVVSGRFEEAKIAEKVLRPPHLTDIDPIVVSADAYNISYHVRSTGGTIPNGQTRYYAVTAYKELKDGSGNVVHLGESTQSNEVRAIIRTGTNTNRIPVEITPVEGATGYKIYMTTEAVIHDPTGALTRPYNWEVAREWVDMTVWESNHLLATVTQEELINLGFVYWDIQGTPTMGPGTFPTVNTALRYKIDYVGQKIHLDKTLSGNSLCILLKQSMNPTTSIKFLPHTGKFYVGQTDGLFLKSETVKKNLLLNEPFSINAIAMDYHDNTIWLSDSTGRIVDEKGITVRHAGGLTYPSPLVGFKMTYDKGIVRMLGNGRVMVDESGTGMDGSSYTLDVPGVGIPVFIGLSNWYGDFITFEKNTKKFVVFSVWGGAVEIKQVFQSSLSNVLCWDLSGNVLTAVIKDVGIVQYHVVAEEYYGLIDKTKIMGVSEYPSMDRPLILNESLPPEYPNLMSNSNLAKGSETPSGFACYKSFGSPTTHEYGLDVDAPPFPGARAWKQTFGTHTEIATASILREHLPVIGGQTLKLSAYVKATETTSNVTLGYRIRSTSGEITADSWTPFANTPNWSLVEIIINVPDDAAELDFVGVLNGRAANSISSATFWIGMIQLQEVLEQPPVVDWNLVSNGDFTKVSEGSSLPLGWSTDGKGSGSMVTAVEPATMSIGNALKITTQKFDLALDNSQFLVTQKFALTTGESFDMSFRHRKTGANEMIYVQGVCFDENGSNANMDGTALLVINAKGGDVPELFNVRLGPLPTRTRYVSLKFDFKDNLAGANHWIENVVAKATSDKNMLGNADFEYGLSGWVPYDVRPTTKDSVRGAEVVPHCAYMKITQADINVQKGSTQITQYVSINQTSPKAISFNARLRADLGPVANPDSARFELIITYMDGTQVSDSVIPGYNGGKYTKTDGSWQDIGTTWTPPKTIKEVTAVLAAGYGHITEVYVNKVELYEVTAVDPYTALKVDAPDVIYRYDPQDDGIRKQVNITTQLVRTDGLGNVVDSAVSGKIINYTVSPNIPEIKVYSQPTNVKGISKAVIEVGNFYGKFTLTASETVGNITKEILVLPRLDKGSKAPRPQIVKNNSNSNAIYLEIETEKEIKPFVRVPDRPGAWEVFRPPVFNVEQALDYAFHIAADDIRYPNVNPALMAAEYPTSIYSTYVDYLSGYPGRTGDWEAVYEKRPEWAAIDLDKGKSGPFGDNRFYYNWADLECTQWYIDYWVNIAMTTKGNTDGIYLDDFWGENGYATLGDFDYAATPSRILNYKTAEERMLSQYNQLNGLRDRLRMEGKHLCANYGCDRNYDFSVSPPVLSSAESKMLHLPFDGLLLEVWGYEFNRKPWEVSNSGFDYHHVRSDIEFLKQMGEKGKWTVALARNTPMDWDSRTFAFVMYLLGKGDDSYFCFEQWGGESYAAYWHWAVAPEHKIWTGLPLETYQVKGGLMSRRFENAIAVLNMDYPATLRHLTDPGYKHFADFGELEIALDAKSINVRGIVRKWGGGYASVTFTYFDANNVIVGAAEEYDLDLIPGSSGGAVNGKWFTKVLTPGTIVRAEVTVNNAVMESLSIESDVDFTLPPGVWHTMRDGTKTGTITLQPRHSEFLVLEKRIVNP